MKQISHNIREGSYFLVNSIDPTRTLTLRNRFVAEFRRRFAFLMRDIKEAVIDLDVLALDSTNRPRINAAGLEPRQFDFPQSDRKVEAFVSWLMSKNTQYILSGKNAGIKIVKIAPGGLQGNTSDARQSWMNTYIDSAYQQGIRRGRQELKKKGIEIDEDFGLMDRDPVQIAFNTPMHADRVGLIYSRAYSSLKGITTEMESAVSDVLAMGIANGKNPREMARLLNKTITGQGQSLEIVDSLGRRIPSKRRAEILARTETIRAHHSANIGTYKSLGIEDVVIMAEHLTAGDSRVCRRCAPLNGKKYKLDEAEYKIPVHPQCRCVAIPWIEGSSFNPGYELPAQVDTGTLVEEINIPSTLKAQYKTKYTKYAKEATLFWKRMKQEYGDNLYSSASLRNDVKEELSKKFGIYAADQGPKTMHSWQGSTYNSRPFAFKLAAYEVEKKGTRKIVVPPRAEHDFNQAKEIFEREKNKAIDLYLIMRSVNQAYMKEILNIGDDDFISLFRGTDGRTGEKHRLELIKINASKKKRTSYTIDDANLTGYTSSQYTADSFGHSVRGITIRQDFKREDIVIHEHLLHGITNSFIGEREYILIGGKRKVPIKDITYYSNEDLDNI